MPHFYFHIRDDEEIIRDEEGLLLPDIETAREEAQRSIHEITRVARTLGRGCEKQVIEITDPNGRVIETLPFAWFTHNAS